MTRGNEHVNAGVLPIDSQGHGTLYITMPQALASFDGILVTEETGTRVSSPSGTRMLAARVGNHNPNSSTIVNSSGVIPACAARDLPTAETLASLPPALAARHPVSQTVISPSTRS